MGSSTEMPRMTSSFPSAPYCVFNSTSEGISARHGPHHVAQKFTTIGLPLKEASFTSTPFMSFSVKSSGAALPEAFASAAASSSAVFAEPVRLPFAPETGAAGFSAPGASMTIRIAIATAAIAMNTATLLGLRSGTSESVARASGASGAASGPVGCSVSMGALNNTLMRLGGDISRRVRDRFLGGRRNQDEGIAPARPDARVMAERRELGRRACLPFEHEQRQVLPVRLVHQVRDAAVCVQAGARVEQRQVLLARRGRHVHVEPETLTEESLRPLRVERLPLGRTEQPEALDVIGGELRGEECVRLAGDDGEEGTDEDDQQRGDGEADRGAQPRAQRGLPACERLTSGSKARRQWFSAEPIRAGAQQLARAAFLARDDATWRAGVEVALHVPALRLREGPIRILRQQGADAATARFHWWLPPASAVTGTTGADPVPEDPAPADAVDNFS